MKVWALALFCGAVAAAEPWIHPFPVGATYSSQPSVGAFVSPELESGPLRFSVDGRDVAPQSRRQGGRIFWVPPVSLPDGAHSATLSGAGATRTWGFVVGPPRPLELTAGTSLKGSIEVQASGPLERARLWIDGAEVPTEVRGNVLRTTAALKAGKHKAHALLRGLDGSVAERSWVFTAGRAQPAELVVQPAANSVTSGIPLIRFRLPRGKLHGQFVFLLDGADQTDAVVQRGRDLDYTPPAALTSGTHRVQVTSKTTTGETFERTWTFHIR